MTPQFQMQERKQLPTSFNIAHYWMKIIYCILKIDHEVLKHCQRNSEVQKGF